MTISLTLTPELEQRLRQAAEQQGLSADALAARLLEQHLPPAERRAVPEIADYEVRRELIRANKVRGIGQLDALARLLEYLPITTTAMRQAARFLGSGPAARPAHGRRQGCGRRHDPRRSSDDLGCSGRRYRHHECRSPVAFRAGRVVAGRSRYVPPTFHTLGLKDGLAAVVRQLAERLEHEATGDQADRLLVAAYVLTGLRLKSPDEVRQLFQGASIAMRDSVTFQAILEEGHVESLHRTILRLGRRRFGEADEAVRQQIEAMRDIERLEDLTERMLIVSSWDELMA